MAQRVRPVELPNGVRLPTVEQGNPAAQELYDSTLSRLTDPIGADFVRRFQQSTLARPVPATFLEACVRDSLKVPARVWRAAVEALMAYDSSSELPASHAPTLIVWGDQDAVLARADQERMAAAIPGARLIVYPGAGHSLYWEMPDRFAADLVAFVETLQPRLRPPHGRLR
jgi:pimeloyl-ACP methyl ester carboxylesterase